MSINPNVKIDSLDDLLYLYLKRLINVKLIIQVFTKINSCLMQLLKKNLPSHAAGLNAIKITFINSFCF